MSINKVMIIGRLGGDPEVKGTPSGASVCNMTVATSDSWVDKQGNKQEKTEWHRIVLWGKLADLAGQHLSKGREVYVEGKLQTRSWEDKDGNKKYTTEILGQNVQFLGSNNQQEQKGSGPSQKNQPQQNQQQASGYTSDDIPF